MPDYTEDTMVYHKLCKYKESFKLEELLIFNFTQLPTVGDQGCKHMNGVNVQAGGRGLWYRPGHKYGSKGWGIEGEQSVLSNEGDVKRSASWFGRDNVVVGCRYWYVGGGGHLH